MFNNITSKYILFVYFTLFLATFAGFRMLGFDADSLGYSNFILNDILPDGTEPTFSWIVSISELFFDSKEYVVRSVFIIYAFINMIILSIAINKFIPASLISLMLYTFTVYPILTLTQIRFGVAVAIFVWAIYDLYLSKKLIFIVKIFIASTFHYSIILALPLFLLSSTNINKRFYFILPLLGLIFATFQTFFMDFISSILEFLPLYIKFKLKYYLFKDYSYMSFLNSLSALLFITYFFAVWQIDRSKNTYMIILVKILGWGIFLYFLSSFMGTLSLRILNTMSVLLIIIIPNLIFLFKQSKFVLFFIILYSIFFFYNLTIRNELLNYEIWFS